jgi:uncharacterized CHY-type Zn-finger protein
VGKSDFGTGLIRPEVKGRVIDLQTRCVHYYSEQDIVAIKFKCCSTYYPCHLCHEEVAGHPKETWHQNEFETKAILCGHCGNQLTISQYLNADSMCIFCNASFNPDCKNHWHLYFEV